MYFVDLNNIIGNKRSLSSILDNLEQDKIDTDFNNLDVKGLENLLISSGVLGYNSNILSQSGNTQLVDGELQPYSYFQIANTSTATKVNFTGVFLNNRNSVNIISNNSNVDVAVTFANVAQANLKDIKNNTPVNDSFELKTNDTLMFIRAVDPSDDTKYVVKELYNTRYVNNTPSGQGNLIVTKAWDIADNPGFINTIPQEAGSPLDSRITITISEELYSKSFKIGFDIISGDSFPTEYMLEMPTPVNGSNTTNVQQILGWYEGTGQIALNISQGNVVNVGKDREIRFGKLNWGALTQPVQWDTKVKKIYLYSYE